MRSDLVLNSARNVSQWVTRQMRTEKHRTLNRQSGNQPCDLKTDENCCDKTAKTRLICRKNEVNFSTSRK